MVTILQFLGNVNRVDFRYPKLWYLKIPCFLKEYSLYISTHVMSSTLWNQTMKGRNIGVQVFSSAEQCRKQSDPSLQNEDLTSSEVPDISKLLKGFPMFWSLWLPKNLQCDIKTCKDVYKTLCPQS